MKKLIISFAFLISFGLATAQLDSTWYHTFEKVNWEELAYDVVPGVDGGYLIAGTLYHSFYRDEEDYDAYFLKIDENGNKEWSVYYGGPDHDLIYSVVATNDSSYMAIGNTMEGNDWGNAWLVKVDKYGDTLWTKQYGGNSYDYGQYIDKTSDGGYILLGLTNGFDDFDNRDGNDEIFLIKTDADGNEQWSNTYTGEMYSRAYCVKEMSDNGFIMALSSVYTWPGESLLTFIKTDAYGNIVWTETMDFEKSESINKILMDEEYLYYIGSVGDNNYPHDVFVVKTSLEGEYLWDQSYGDENNQMAIDAVFSPTENILITGKTGSILNYNINALSISKEGDSINTQTFGSNYHEIPYAMSLVENDEIIIVGCVGTGEDKGDAFALKLAFETTGVEQIPWPASFEFNIIPNPVKNKSTLYFELNSNFVANLTVYDTYGRQITTLFNGILSSGKQQIDFNFSGYEAGIYFVKLESGDQVEVQKIIVSR